MAPDSSTNAARRLQDREAGRFLRLARKAIAASLRAPAGRAPASAHATTSNVVNITIRTDGRLRGSMSGQGLTLAEAVTIAARRASRDRRFGPPVSFSDLDHAVLELWIQKDAQTISKEQAITLDLGLDGIELRRSGAFAYYKPSVPLTSGIVSPVNLLSKLSRKAGLPPSAWRDPETELRRTAWNHYVERAEAPSGLVRLRRLRHGHTPEVSADALRQRARLAEDRLLAVQSGDGLYLYQYHPLTQKASGARMNIVRQAGCAYAMAAAAAHEQDENRPARLEESAALAVKFLLSRASWTSDGRLLVVAGGTSGERPERCKLGTLALLLLALQYGPFPGMYRKERHGLVATMLSLQNEDGSFRCCADGPITIDAAQNFSPGEALLALVREGRRGTPGCGTAVGRAFSWYRDHFRRAPSTAFVLWQVDAWRLALEWANQSGQGKWIDPTPYADFVFEMIDWLLQFQFGTNVKPRDFAGGFSQHGSYPGFSTATYAEAVIRACGLAGCLGRRERMARYRESALLALGFLFRLQITPELAFLFRDRARAIGGTTRSLQDFTIRSDFDQHVITALIAALETPGLLT